MGVAESFCVTERRNRQRDSPQGEPERAYLVRMIQRTYCEMPGLNLSLQQAGRLFGLRESTCRLVLDDLVRADILRKSEDGRYVAARHATS